jgi:hypothetical protein
MHKLLLFKGVLLGNKGPEVQLVNAVAPFILCNRLVHMMIHTSASDFAKDGIS